MNIRRVKHHNIELSKWDEMCARGQFNWFSASWYLNANNSAWDALILNDYQAAIPLPRRWILNKSVYQPFFTRAYTILGEANNEEQKALVAALATSFKGHLALETLQVKLEFGEERRYQLLDLQKGIKFNSNAKRNIKKAKQLGLVVKPMGTQAAVSFFKAHTGQKLKGYKNKHYAYLYRLLNSAQQPYKWQLLGAFQEERCYALAIFAQYQYRALYLAGASNDEGKKHGASHFLIHHYLENQKRLEELDFGGSDVEGVARFYLSFGAENKKYQLLRF